MRWGFGMERGPFEGWDLMGVARTVERMEKDGLTVPDKVKRCWSAGNTTFYKVEKRQALFYDFATEGYKPIRSQPDHDLPGHAQGRQQGGSWAMIRPPWSTWATASSAPSSIPR
jgi:hypothetical protein